MHFSPEDASGQDNDRSESCWALALTAALGSVAICSLYWRGWSVTGHVVDVVPCLLTAFLVAFLIHVSGRLKTRWTMVVSAVTASLAIVVGKILAWDLFGFTSQFSNIARTVDGTWYKQLLSSWEQYDERTQWLNGGGLLLTPLLSALIVPAFQWINRRQMLTNGRTEQTANETTNHATELDCQRAMRFRYGIMVSFWVLVLSLLYLSCHDPQRSGFLLMSVPAGEGTRQNPLPGFAALVEGRPVMTEQIPACEQVGWFCGGIRSDNNFRFKRAGYGFLGAWLTPLFGSERTLLAVNVMAWWLSVWFVWRLAWRWFDDRVTAAIAAMLAAAGCGFCFHLDATTPHLVSFAMYYGGLLMLWEWRISEVRWSWSRHAAIGLTIGLIGLTYNTSYMLLFVYVLGGLFRQRWIHVAGGCCLAMATRHVWQMVLPALGINLENVESGYLQRALGLWSDAYQTGLGAFLRMALWQTWECFTACESPLLVTLGLLGTLTVLSRRQRLFSLLVMLAPTLACTLFSPAATARGYIVYGFSLVLFVGAARLLALSIRGSTRRRTIALVATAACLAFQVAWGTAHFRGNLGPLTIYMLGWDDGLTVLVNGPPEVVSLTGQENVPTLFGGTATFAEAGALVTPATARMSRRSRILALTSRLLFLLVIAALLCTLFQERRARRIAVSLLLGAALIATELGYRSITVRPNPFHIDQGVSMQPGSRLKLTAIVAESTTDHIESFAGRPEYRAGVFVGASENTTVTLLIGTRIIPLQPVGEHIYQTDLDQLLAALRESRSLSVVLINTGTTVTWVAGWQRGDAHQRFVQSPSTAPVIPAVELRVWSDRDGMLRFAAF